MANLRSMKYAKSLHTLKTILNPSYCADSQPTPASPPGFSRPKPQEMSPPERFLRHTRPNGRQRQVLPLRQPDQAGREVRHRPTALFDEEPAGRKAEHTSEYQSLMSHSSADC